MVAKNQETERRWEKKEARDKIGQIPNDLLPPTRPHLLVFPAPK